jgi:hypothetical protein
VLKKDDRGLNCLQRFLWRCLRRIPERWLGGTLQLHVVPPCRIVVGHAPDFERVRDLDAALRAAVFASREDAPDLWAAYKAKILAGR